MDTLDVVTDGVTEQSGVVRRGNADLWSWLLAPCAVRVHGARCWSSVTVVPVPHGVD